MLSCASREVRFIGSGSINRKLCSIVILKATMYPLQGACLEAKIIIIILYRKQANVSSLATVLPRKKIYIYGKREIFGRGVNAVRS